MKTSNFVNRRNLKNAFNADNNSFNRAFRFLFDLSKQPEVKIPASPAEDDKTPKANMLRAEIRDNTAKNNNIADAKKIMNVFGVTTCNDKALKDAKKLTDKFLPNVCSKIVKKIDGTESVIFAGVKFAKLPTYMKEVSGVEYNKIFAVIESSWIDRIFDAAENIDRLNNEGIDLTKYDAEEARNIYELTEAPKKIETTPQGSKNKVYTWEEAKGDIVDAKGFVITEIDEVKKIWYKEAIRNANANDAGRTAKKEYLKNNQ